MRLLIEAGADVNAQNGTNMTPLVATCCAREDYIETANVLLENDAEINASERYAVKVALMFDSKELVNFLVGRGASLKASESEYTALHAASLHGRVDIADTLIAYGVGVNSHDFR